MSLVLSLSNPGGLQNKRRTDLERSVSLLTPHYPSDHMQIVVQRPLLSLLKSYAIASAVPPLPD
jgi:hypothetical protein